MKQSESDRKVGIVSNVGSRGCGGVRLIPNWSISFGRLNEKISSWDHALVITGTLVGFPPGWKEAKATLEMNVFYEDGVGSGGYHELEGHIERRAPQSDDFYFFVGGEKKYAPTINAVSHGLFGFKGRIGLRLRVDLPFLRAAEIKPNESDIVFDFRIDLDFRGEGDKQEEEKKEYSLGSPIDITVDLSRLPKEGPFSSVWLEIWETKNTGSETVSFEVWNAEKEPFADIARKFGFKWYVGYFGAPRDGAKLAIKEGAQGNIYEFCYHFEIVAKSGQGLASRELISERKGTILSVRSKTRVESFRLELQVKDDGSVVVVGTGEVENWSNPGLKLVVKIWGRRRSDLQSDLLFEIPAETEVVDGKCIFEAVLVNLPNVPASNAIERFWSSEFGKKLKGMVDMIATVRLDFPGRLPMVWGEEFARFDRYLWLHKRQFKDVYGCDVVTKQSNWFSVIGRDVPAIYRQAFLFVYNRDMFWYELSIEKGGARRFRSIADWKIGALKGDGVGELSAIPGLRRDLFTSMKFSSSEQIDRYYEVCAQLRVYKNVFKNDYCRDFDGDGDGYRKLASSNDAATKEDWPSYRWGTLSGKWLARQGHLIEPNGIEIPFPNAAWGLSMRFLLEGDLKHLKQLYHAHCRRWGVDYIFVDFEHIDWKHFEHSQSRNVRTPL